MKKKYEGIKKAISNLFEYGTLARTTKWDTVKNIMML
jgi:hypothetical protein